MSNDTDDTDDTFGSIKSKRLEHSRLIERLSKYDFIQKNHNFCLSEIERYTLVPIGREPRTNKILYSTVVNLKNNKKIELSFNLREFLNEDKR